MDERDFWQGELEPDLEDAESAWFILRKKLGEVSMYLAPPLVVGLGKVQPNRPRGQLRGGGESSQTAEGSQQLPLGLKPI